MDSATLRYQAQLSGFVIDRNIEGLTQDDSLIQPEKNGNCLNWVMGHIVRSRLRMLQVLGKELPYSVEALDVYESTPVLNAEQATAWKTLIEQFNGLKQPVEDALGSVTAEQMSVPAPFSPSNNPEETIGSLLAGFMYHEAYHSGQLALLRRVTGHPGAIGSPTAQQTARA